MTLDKDPTRCVARTMTYVEVFGRSSYALAPTILRETLTGTEKREGPKTLTFRIIVDFVADKN